MEEVEALRRHLRLERLTIAGHSHGGFVALKYALAYPEHVDRLLLLNSGTFVRELDAEWMSARAGFAEAQARWEAVDKNLPDDELHAEFLRTFVPVVDLDEETIGRIFEDAEQALDPIVTHEDGIRFAARAHIVTGIKS